jgi:hypothetical protein
LTNLAFLSYKFEKFLHKQLSNINFCQIEILRFCSYDSGNFTILPIQEIAGYPLVLSTCSMAGKLKNLGLFDNHFDMVIIDECAQATEVEAVTAFIRLLNTESGKLVLAGDP